MPVDKGYVMKIVEPKRVLKTERRARPVPTVPARPSTQQIVRAFKKAPDYEDIVARIPKAATARGWDEGTQIAYFGVCSKTRSARSGKRFGGVSLRT